VIENYDFRGEFLSTIGLKSIFVKHGMCDKSQAKFDTTCELVRNQREHENTYVVCVMCGKELKRTRALNRLLDSLHLHERRFICENENASCEK
jgi:hypothetical protein